jgi:transcriptional antiterminator RfaH
MIAVTNLIQQDYAAYCPMVDVKKRTNQGWKVVAEPLFPNYVFIKLNDTSDNWKPIRSTRGVNGFVRFGSGLPAPMPSDVVEKLLSLNMDTISDVLTSYPKAGDRVQVSMGDTWLDAVVKADNGKGRVQVLLNIIGQEQTLWVESSAIQVFN